MLTEDGKHLYVSYDEYHSLIEKLALKVYQSGWEFDTILCLARGGLRPGDILSRIFDKPLAIMSTSSYRAEAGTVQGHLDIARFITTPKGEIAGRFRFSSFFHAIVAGFAVQRCPCWEDLGGGEEGLQKGVILGLIG
jgi:hypothetical protein